MNTSSYSSPAPSSRVNLTLPALLLLLPLEDVGYLLGGRGSVLLTVPLALLVGGGRGMGGGLPLALLLVGGAFAGRGMGGGREVWREAPAGT